MSKSTYIVEYRLPGGDWTPVPKLSTWYKHDSPLLTTRTFASYEVAERFGSRVMKEFQTIGLSGEVRVSDYSEYLLRLGDICSEKNHGKKQHWRLAAAAFCSRNQ